MDTNTPIQVQFHCHQCQSEIHVMFDSNPFATVRCPQCDYSYALTRPTIGEEILLDWEKEALFQKIRADQTEHDKTQLMLLVIKVIELLTWRDEGNGHIRAIETLRQWLLLNGVPKALIELLDAKGAENSFPAKHKK